MRRLPVFSGVLVAAALSVAACGGTPAASSVPTIPPVNVPSIPPLGSFAIPSFAGDPELVAKFPKTINGQTVGPVQSALYAEIFTAFGGQEEAQQFAQAMAAINVNPATVSYATAKVELNEKETITAIRTPGVSAGTFINSLPSVVAILQPDEAPPVVGQVSIAGKTVTTLTNADGDVTYFYPSGDTIWSADATDTEDLAAIFGAVQ